MVRLRDGVIDAIEWRVGESAANSCYIDGAEPGERAPIRLLLPALVDLHAHFRQPGAAASEDVASGSRAAARGGYGTVCLMPNTEPAVDSVAALRAATAVRAAAAKSPEGIVRILPIGAVTLGRRGEHLAPFAALATAGAIGFSDDGSPVTDDGVFREALVVAGRLGLPVIEHAEEPRLTHGGEAAGGAVATRLGLRHWPAAGELEAVRRDIALLRDALAVEPRARLHLTHLSTAAALDAVRAARAEGLSVSCDVTPHHVALTDAWIAGDRRWAWEQSDAESLRLSPDIDSFDQNLRVSPPLRSADDAAACRSALRDGTAIAIATDHAPHSRERKEVEFGGAANGIAGIETALSVALAARAAGELSLATIARALVAGPARLLPAQHAPKGIAVGARADLTIVDLGSTWVPSRSSLVGRSTNTPLLGRELPGVIELTVVDGRVAWESTSR